jgi:hypothetical protein
MNVVKYPLPIHEIINRFQEAVNDMQLCYRTNDLYKAGIETEADLNEALLKTIRILRIANLDSTHYLKKIYVTEIESGKIYPDWKMNKLAFFFAILNAESQNHLILQWKKKIINMLRI